MKKLFYSALTGLMMCLAMLGFARAQHTFTFDPVSGSTVDEGTEIQVSVSPTASEFYFEMFASMEEAEQATPSNIYWNVYGPNGDGYPEITAEKPVVKVAVPSGTGFDVAYATYEITDNTPHLTFDLSGNQYGRYVPFHATLMYKEEAQQNFEVYYSWKTTASKDNYDPDDEEEILRAEATDGTAELMITDGMAFYFNAKAYFEVDGETLVATMAKELYAPEFDKPSFDTVARIVEKNTVVRIKSEPGATIYYSLDAETLPLMSAYQEGAANPTVFKYNDTEGIKITEEVVIWAIAYKEFDGVLSGSEMCRGKFELIKPTVTVNFNPEVYVIGEEYPTVTVDVPEEFTLGTDLGDMALELYIYSSDPTAGWKQVITQNGTKLDMSKAVENNHEDSWTIQCKLVNGDDFSKEFVGFVSVVPMLYIQIDKNGEKPEPPVASVPSGTVDKGTEVELTCPTEGAEIYYTTGPEFPTILYTKPFVINADMSIRTEARKDGIASDLVVFTYKIPVPPLSVEATVTPAPGEILAGTEIEIELSEKSGTQDITGYMLYPTLEAAKEDSLAFAYKCSYYPAEGNPVPTVENPVLRVGVYKEVNRKWKYFDFVYIIKKDISMPVITPAGGEVAMGTEVEIKHAEGVQGAKIYYTLNDSVPEVGKDYTQEYTQKIKITEAVTIKAMAFKAKTGENDRDSVSNVTEAVFTLLPLDTVEAPTFSIFFGEVEKGTKVSIASVTPDAVIYYTLDGEDPTEESTLYSEPIEINEDVTIKAIATKEYMANSKVSAKTYTVKPTANEGDELAGVSIYPNPTDGEFTVVAPVNTEVEIFTAVGVMVKRMVVAEGNAQVRLDNSGIYFIRVRANGQAAIRKVVVR